MITLHDFLQDMAYGEFNEMALGGFLFEEHEVEPDPRDWARLVSHINLGLKKIYARFKLMEDTCVVTMDSSLLEYVLSYDYAASNVASTQPIKYITDGSDTFLDNVLKIESIVDQDGDEVSVNDDRDTDSEGNLQGVFTPDFRTLKLPSDHEFTSLTVTYRAHPAKIVYDSAWDVTAIQAIEVVIPPGLQEALQFFVASRALAKTHPEEAGAYRQMFLNALGENLRDGLYVDDEKTNSSFNDRGWC